MADTEKKIDFIQGLRGLAAVWVVLHHYLSAYAIGHGGYIGVDLFFVISGYIMALTTRFSDGSGRYVGLFFIKRFSRVWPPYAVVTLVTFILFRSLNLDIQPPLDFGLLMKSLLFVPTGPTGFPVAGAGWSLVFEMYFYLVFGLSMLAGKNRWYVFAGWIFVTLVLIHPFVPLDPRNQTAHSYSELVTSPLIWLFVTGIVVERLSALNGRIGNVWYIHGVFVVSVAWVTLGYFLRKQVYHDMFWGLPFGGLLFALTYYNERKPIRLNRSILLLGSVSYSLYLTHHQVFLIFAQKIYPTYDHGLALFPLCMAIVALLTAACYLGCEEKLSSWVKVFLTKGLAAGKRGPCEHSDDQIVTEQ